MSALPATYQHRKTDAGKRDKRHVCKKRAQQAVIYYFHVKNVEQRGVLNVTFVDYVNPGKRAYKNQCCDLDHFACGDCDTYFEICLQATYVPVASLGNCSKFVKTETRSGDNFNFKSAFGTHFGSRGEKNPIEYHFNDSWKVCV